MGPLVRWIRYTWETPHHDAVWDALVASGTTIAPAPGQRTDGSPAITLGPALPEPDLMLIAVLGVARTSDKGLLKWHLLLYEPPNSEPPEAVIDANRRCGGQAGLRSLIGLGAGSPPPATQLRVHIDLPAESWRCRVLQTPVSSIDGLVSPLGKTATREEIGYRFEDGLLGLKEISLLFDHEKQVFHVNCVAQPAWLLDDGAWSGHHDRISGLIVNTMFSNVEVT